MDTNARLLVNTLQSHFPIVARPFKAVATELHLEEHTVLVTLERLLQEGFLTRFGPLFNAERLGGGVTLAAMTLPENDFARVANRVNAFPEVAHNYARDHHLNMWFVVATETREEIASVLAQIEQQTGYTVFNMPKQEEYCLGFKVQIGAEGIDTVPFLEAKTTGLGMEKTSSQPDTLDRAIVTATQDGLPVCATPYHTVAMALGVEASIIMERMAAMLAQGWIRRIGVVPNHYRLGLKGNGMVVWDLPDDKVHSLGRLVGSLGFVSHCYRRPRHLPHWPYNLFAMVHGQDQQAVADKVETIRVLLQEDVRDYTVLYSTKILKKTGLRIKKSHQ